MLHSAINDPHAVHTRETIRLARDGTMKTVLLVQTDLALNPDDPEHYRDAFANLTGRIRDYMKAHPHIDSADLERIVRVRDR